MIRNAARILNLNFFLILRIAAHAHYGPQSEYSGDELTLFLVVLAASKRSLSVVQREACVKGRSIFLRKKRGKGKAIPVKTKLNSVA
jgi:hypothetical protein